MTTIKQQTQTGMVYKKTSGVYSIYYDGIHYSCKLNLATTHKNNVKKNHARKHVDPIAVGDQVRFEILPGHNGLITEILPRRNQLSRKTSVPMPGAKPFEQVIVANVDWVIPVFFFFATCS